MIKYIVKKEERVIIAILGTKPVRDAMSDRLVCYSAMGKLNKIFRSSKYIDLMYFENDFKVKNVYTGVAKCSPEDEWNEEFGKELAKNRAIQKLKDDERKIYEKVLDKIEKVRIELINAIYDCNGSDYKAEPLSIKDAIKIASVKVDAKNRNLYKRLATK